MSAEPPSLPEDPGPGFDGFGPESLGHRVPALRVSGKIAAQVARLTMRRGAEPPLLPEGEIVALLSALAERYAAARERRESFEVTITLRAHDGRHRETRWNEDRRIGP